MSNDENTLIRGSSPLARTNLIIDNRINDSMKISWGGLALGVTVAG